MIQYLLGESFDFRKKGLLPQVFSQSAIQGKAQMICTFCHQKSTMDVTISVNCFAHTE